MSERAYQLLSLAARALFIGLAVLAVLKASFSLLAQHRERRRLLRLLPDAGTVGELRDLQTDASYPLPREGVLGSSRGCDIRLPGLRRRHAFFAYVPRRGILITPCHRRSGLSLDDAPVKRRGYAFHGTTLRVGRHALMVRVFAGLDVPEAGSPAVMAGEEEAFSPFDENYPPLWYEVQPQGGAAEGPAPFGDAPEGFQPAQPVGEDTVLPEYDENAGLPEAPMMRRRRSGRRRRK